MSTTDYDFCIIGTSPICLYNAKLLSDKGHNVLLIDENNLIGGAWKSKDIFNLKNVELGCHLIPPTYKIYNFLEKDLGIELVEMKPQPLRIFSNEKYLFDNIKPLILQRIFIQKKIIKILINKFMRIFRLRNNHNSINEKNSFQSNISKRNNFATYKSILDLLFNYSGIFEGLALKDKKFLYPKNGSFEIIFKILKLLDKNKVIIKKNLKVINAKEENKNLIKLELSNKKHIYVKNLLITSQTYIEFIQDQNGRNYFSRDRGQKQHLILLLENDNFKKISYVEFLNSEYFRRVSDITLYNNYPIDKRLLCIELKYFQKNLKITRKLLDNLLIELVKSELINSKTKVIDYYIDYQIYIYGSNKLSIHKNKFSNIKFLNTSNLSFIK